MGNFFKEHSYNIVKLFLNQIGITVFGTMLALATSGNETLLLGSSIFSILFLLALDYNSCWEIGAKDKIRIDGGRLAPMPYKGALLSALANVPNLLLALLMGVGILIGNEAGRTMSAICNTISRILNGMYLGVIKVLEYTIYTAPKLSGAADILASANPPTPEISEALTVINSAHAGYSGEPISKAMEIVGAAAADSDAAAGADALLESAYKSPDFTDVWWWFALIAVPAILVGWLAYYLGSKNIKLSSPFTKNNTQKQ